MTVAEDIAKLAEAEPDPDVKAHLARLAALLRSGGRKAEIHLGNGERGIVTVYGRLSPMTDLLGITEIEEED